MKLGCCDTRLDSYYPLRVSHRVLRCESVEVERGGRQAASAEISICRARLLSHQISLWLEEVKDRVRVFSFSNPRT